MRALPTVAKPAQAQLSILAQRNGRVSRLSGRIDTSNVLDSNLHTIVAGFDVVLRAVNQLSLNRRHLLTSAVTGSPRKNLISKGRRFRGCAFSPDGCEAVVACGSESTQGLDPALRRRL